MRYRNPSRVPVDWVSDVTTVSPTIPQSLPKENEWSFYMSEPHVYHILYILKNVIFINYVAFSFSQGVQGRLMSRVFNYQQEGNWVQSPTSGEPLRKSPHYSLHVTEVPKSL